MGTRGAAVVHPEHGLAFNLWKRTPVVSSPSHQIRPVPEEKHAPCDGMSGVSFRCSLWFGRRATRVPHHMFVRINTAFIFR